ncbi:hypothetical protein [Pseudomonas aeruginosa]|uniref:hypothetical protein n=1 Tax=Pseudomonas aeruginosa TaxID=287 RepID=UPI0021ADCCA4
MKPMIQAHLVERDQFGFWTHPNYPDLADNCSSSEAQETLRRLGLELQNVFMESDAPRLYDSARSDQRYSEWIPTRPEGAGWFVLSIHDTDNGPVCQYVRPLGEHLSPIGLDAAAEQHERLLSEACAKALNQRDAALARVAELERPEVMGWRDRILSAHPGSDPRYWPDALLVQHMTAEIAELRAILPKQPPAQDLEHVGSLISVFRNAIRDDAKNGGREYFEKARSAEQELRQEIDRIVGALRADRDSWAEQAEQRLADWDEMRKERDAAQARVEQQERTIAGMNEAHAKLAELYEAAQARVAELEMLLRKLSTNGLMQFSTVDEEMAVQAALGGAPVAQAQHSAGYAEARQCVNCRHIGINDAADYAACHDCRWTGPEPDEDKCPGCGSENCMAAACPECGGRYELVAETGISAPAAQAQHSVPDGYRLIRLEHFAAIKTQLNPEQVDAYRGRNIYDEDKVYANWNACRSALDEIKDVFQQIDWDAENELADLLAAGSSQAKPSTDDGQGGRP